MLQTDKTIQSIRIENWKEWVNLQTHRKFEMAGWHQRLDGHESEWTLGVGDGQGGLACCDSWGCKESDTTEWLNWTDRKFVKIFVRGTVSGYMRWWYGFTGDTYPLMKKVQSSKHYHFTS